MLLHTFPNYHTKLYLIPTYCAFPTLTDILCFPTRNRHTERSEVSRYLLWQIYSLNGKYILNLKLTDYSLIAHNDIVLG